MEQPLKKCPRCGALYPRTLEFWGTNKSKKDGLSCWCSSCKAENERTRRHANPDKRRESDRRYIESHREQVLAAQRRRYANNPTPQIQAARLYRAMNPEQKRTSALAYRKANASQIREALRTYYKEHPDKAMIKYRRRRARKRNAEGSFTEAEVIALFREQEGYCFHCGCDLIPVGFHRDHWIPLSRGGSDWINNIRLLCESCNLSKGAKLPHEWKPEMYAMEKTPCSTNL